MKSIQSFVVIGAATAVALFLLIGCSQEQQAEIKQEAETIKQEVKVERDAAFQERQWDDGVYQAEKGLEQLDAFDRNLAEADPDGALKHLKKSAEHFDKARTHFAKAEVGREKQGAIDDINHGYDALDKAIADLEAGNVDSAQRQLDKAYDHFAQANQTLG